MKASDLIVDVRSCADPSERGRPSWLASIGNRKKTQGSTDYKQSFQRTHSHVTSQEQLASTSIRSFVNFLEKIYNERNFRTIKIIWAIKHEYFEHKIWDHSAASKKFRISVLGMKARSRKTWKTTAKTARLLRAEFHSMIERINSRGCAWTMAATRSSCKLSSRSLN